MAEVVNRRASFSRAIERRYPNWEDRIETCDCCLAYTVPCLRHPYGTCHRNRVFFVDGSCIRNGYREAASGVGVASGDDPEDQQWSIPITDEIDSGARTSQRAELLAAIMALKQIRVRDPMNYSDDHEYGELRPIIIASDSDYLYRGITQWYPQWRENQWTNSRGYTPANLDLFHKIHSMLCNKERYGLEIGFCWVPRDRNETADRLAREAARLAADGYF